MPKVIYEVGDTSQDLNGLHESLFHIGKSQLSERYNGDMKKNLRLHEMK
jgi:hypothetical protein